MFKVKWFAQLNGWSAAIDEGKKSSSRLESFYSDDTLRSGQWIQPAEQGQDTTEIPSSFSHNYILLLPPWHALVLLYTAPLLTIISVLRPQQKQLISGRKAGDGFIWLKLRLNKMYFESKIYISQMDLKRTEVLDEIHERNMTPNKIWNESRVLLTSKISSNSYTVNILR